MNELSGLNGEQSQKEKEKQIAPASKPDEHHWSGWPGAFCLKCYCSDPLEDALAEGNYVEVADGSEIGFHYEFPNVTPTSCSVLGELIWNAPRGAWDLKKPDGTTEAFYKDNMGQS